MTAQATDPIRQHYLAALSRRIPAASGLLRQRLEYKLSTALAAGGPCPNPGLPAGDMSDRSDGRVPGSRVEPVPRQVSRSPLAQLNDDIRQRTQGAEALVTSRPEIKSVRRFVDLWSRIAAQDDVAQAMARGPENAGPLNSHMLVLRSLSLMRDLSPDYLHRFLVQVNSLLWLEQAIPESTANNGKSTRRTRRQAPIQHPPP